MVTCVTCDLWFCLCLFVLFGLCELFVLGVAGIYFGFDICIGIDCCVLLVVVDGDLSCVNCCLAFACGICYVMSQFGFICMFVYVYVLVICVCDLFCV